MDNRYNILVKDVLDFTYKHKGFEKAFLGWDSIDLLVAINWAIKDKAFGWCCDEAGNLEGYAICKPDKINNTLHIVGILTIKDEGQALLRLVELARKHYPDYKLMGNRNGKLKTYNVDKLLKKLRYNARQPISL